MDDRRAALMLALLALAGAGVRYVLRARECDMCCRPLQTLRPVTFDSNRAPDFNRVDCTKPPAVPLSLPVPYYRGNGLIWIMQM